MKNKPIIILAGGFGTRLKSYLDGRPKPMVDVNGKPFLEYILKNLLENGFIGLGRYCVRERRSNVVRKRLQ